MTPTTLHIPNLFPDAPWPPPWHERLWGEYTIIQLNFVAAVFAVVGDPAFAGGCFMGFRVYVVALFELDKSEVARKDRMLVFNTSAIMLYRCFVIMLNPSRCL